MVKNMNETIIKILTDENELQRYLERQVYDARVTRLTNEGMGLADAMLEADMQMINGFQSDFIEFGEQMPLDLTVE